MEDQTNDRESVARQILCYLRDHPTAADSAEGVRQWWLRGASRVSEEVVHDALEALLKRGWLVTHGSAVKSRIYALNTNEAALERILAQPGDLLNG